jgi:glycosyltransferase involved in cell wall biosynthesis
MIAKSRALMTKITHLTVGVLARDGLPHLQMCLQSLPALADCAENVGFLLVDSASKDGTLEAMCAFASRSKHVRVFAMKGCVNQSVTRNVILDNAAPGAVLLVDGDVAISRDFVLAALAEIAGDNAEIVHGQLPEIWHTSEHRAYADGGDRYQISRRRYTHYFMGNVMLGPQVLASGCRYDPQMRRFEDVEFSIRISEHFRILALPIPIGTHYTIQYHSPYRIAAFYKDAYLRPAGRFIRINLRRPRRLWWARTIFAGHLIGVTEQFCLLLAVISFSPSAIAVVAAFIGADVGRFAIKGRLRQFIPIRVRGPWQIVSGAFMEKPVSLEYETIEIRLSPDAA